MKSSLGQLPTSVLPEKRVCFSKKDHCSILNFLNPSIVSGSIQPTEDLFLYVPPQPSSIPTWMSNKDLLNGEMND